MQARADSPEGDDRTSDTSFGGQSETSLEHLLQNDIPFGLLRAPSWVSDTADIPLPESPASSTPNGTIRQAIHESPIQDPSSFNHQSRGRETSPSFNYRRVRTEEPEGHHAAENFSTGPGESFARYEEEEPNPLWYRSQTFSHRYGSSRRELLFRPPVRASTLPVESSSRSVRSIPRTPTNDSSYSSAIEQPVILPVTMPQRRRQSVSQIAREPVIDSNSSNRDKAQAERPKVLSQPHGKRVTFNEAAATEERTGSTAELPKLRAQTGEHISLSRSATAPPAPTQIQFTGQSTPGMNLASSPHIRLIEPRRLGAPETTSKLHLTAPPPPPAPPNHGLVPNNPNAIPVLPAPPPPSLAQPRLIEPGRTHPTLPTHLDQRRSGTVSHKVENNSVPAPPPTLALPEANHTESTFPGGPPGIPQPQQIQFIMPSKPGLAAGNPSPSQPQVQVIEPRKPDEQSDERFVRVRRRGTGDTDDSVQRRASRHGSEMAVVRKRTPSKSASRNASSKIPANFSFASYSRLVDRLTDHMPQLINVRGDSCRSLDNGAIYCYDTLETGGQPRLMADSSHTYPSAYPNWVRSLRADRVRNVRSRYILVEDLSPRAIDNLGSTFWLNPEFFEEHLNQSGYRPNSYIDPHPRTWNTSEVPKDYASIRWFRPVHRSRVRPTSDLDREKLVTNDGELRWKTTTPEEGAVEKVVRLATNIFRREWAVVSDPNEAVREGDEDDTFPVAWEEKVTVQISQSPGRPLTFIILLDPLPSLTVETNTETNKDNFALRNVSVPFTQAYSRAPMSSTFGLLDIFNGAPLQEGSIQMLASGLAKTSCTREDLTAWLDNMHLMRPTSTDYDMITGLFWIIHRDVVGFLHFVSTTLEEIGLQATDDYLIQKRLPHWRHLIARFQTELPAMRSSIQRFYEFFLENKQRLERAEGFIHRTLDLLDEHIVENEKSYAALRADMALLESKRAIDQAESVGKLTELGFLFIPISCIASLFSMQVQPLETPVPLYSVVIAVMITISLIYIVRLSIRSNALMDYKRELSRKIRLHTKLPPGSPIPTRIFLFYMTKDVEFHKFLMRRIWQPVGILILIFVGLAALLLPIVFLWTRNRHMDAGFKGTITALVFFFDIGIALPFLTGPALTFSGLSEAQTSYDKDTDSTASRSSRKSTSTYRTDGSGNSRKSQRRWQRGLLTTADWLRGKQRRENDTESYVTSSRSASAVSHDDYTGETDSYKSNSSSRHTHRWYDIQPSRWRPSQHRWQRGLISTTDWLRGKQKRGVDTESMGYYSDYTSSSSYISPESSRNGDRVPAPYSGRKRDSDNESGGDSRPAARTTRTTGVIEELPDTVSNRSTQRPRPANDESSDDEAYEQLAPSRRPTAPIQRDQSQGDFRSSARQDTLQSTSIASWDQNLALVLYNPTAILPHEQRGSESAETSSTASSRYVRHASEPPSLATVDEDDQDLLSLSEISTASSNHRERREQDYHESTRSNQASDHEGLPVSEPGRDTPNDAPAPVGSHGSHEEPAPRTGSTREDSTSRPGSDDEANGIDLYDR